MNFGKMIENEGILDSGHDLRNLKILLNSKIKGADLKGLDSTNIIAPEEDLNGLTDNNYGRSTSPDEGRIPKSKKGN